MAKLNTKIDVEITRYTLFILPVAKFSKVGCVSRLTFLGIPIYQRCGDARQLFGFTYGV